MDDQQSKLAQPDRCASSSDDCVAALIDALGGDRVRTGADIPARNMQDACHYAPTRPLALIVPRSTDEVSTALRVCRAHGQPVVVQGGLTGLAGGAHPYAGEIALSLEKMVGIEELDQLSGTLTALAGTPLATIQEAANRAGLLCGIDLGARGSCSIGGNVATNAGGNQVVRYGMTRKNVLGLEVVLADGTVVRSLNKMIKNNAGFDWTQLFIGSEGTLGVVTRVVLGLHPQPGKVCTALVAVDTFADCVALLRAIDHALPGQILVFEAMWKDFMAVATERLGLAPPFAQAHGIVLLIEVAAVDDALEQVLAQAHARGAVRDALVAQSGGDQKRFWQFRESIYEYGRLFPHLVGFDIAIPLDRMEEASAAMRQELATRFAHCVAVFFGHVADSNLHIVAAAQHLDEAGKEEIERAIYRMTAAFGGSISAEHGIGRGKRPYLALSREANELELMRRLKAALDPSGILNQGRVL
ncbi:MAG: FAD-binding oxidoreductase [Xanthobacteraceae bacterium]|nr:MAG: FAD-binding oxidoreductase [Xanthobacteraceae bacterium]